jgi:hypothetical protein
VDSHLPLVVFRDRVFVVVVCFDSIYEVVCVATQSAIVSYGVSYERSGGHDKSDWRDLFSPNEQNERRTSLTNR